MNTTHTQPIRAAVVGGGAIGAGKEYATSVQPGSHAHAYDMSSDIDLVGIVEPHTARHPFLQKEYSGVPIFESIDALCCTTKPDIVSIATPTEYHAEHVERIAAYRPNIILCEKPLAYEKKVVQQMIHTCDREGVLLFVNHQRHFDSLLREWAQRVKDGILGALYQGTAYYYNGWYNNGTHLIDLLVLFAGPVSSVCAYTNPRTSDKEGDPSIDAVLFFEQGMRIAVHSLSKNYGHFGCTLFGELGMIDVGNLGYTISYKKKVPNELYNGVFTLESPGVTAGTPRSMFADTVAFLVDVYHGTQSPEGTAKDALHVMSVLDACRESASHDGKRIIII